jgi:hypothetical protein
VERWFTKTVKFCELTLPPLAMQSIELDNCGACLSVKSVLVKNNHSTSDGYTPEELAVSLYTGRCFLFKYFIWSAIQTNQSR